MAAVTCFANANRSVGSWISAEYDWSANSPVESLAFSHSVAADDVASGTHKAVFIGEVLTDGNWVRYASISFERGVNTEGLGRFDFLPAHKGHKIRVVASVENGLQFIGHFLEDEPD